MSFLLRIFIVFTCICVSALAASLPNTISKSPSAKAIRSKPSRPPRNKERYDSSVNDYQSERICGFNELCKEEFSTKFRCRCPYWSFCSSPGRYYNAFCTMSGAGYLWTQPQGGSFFQRPSKAQRFSKKVHKSKSDRGSSSLSLPHSLMTK